MITLKFEKQGAMSYISHIDLLKHVVRTIRRTGVDVKYSEGFNPHMLINLGVALPLGIKSSAEYVTVNTDVDVNMFFKLYNASAPEGLKAVEAYQVNKNPNLAGTVVAADYSVKHKGAEVHKKEIENIVNLKEYYINYPTKKKPDGTKDVIPCLYGLKVYSDTIIFCIAAGNETLRADKFVSALAEKFAFNVDLSEIWRYNQYIRENILVNVDDYLKK